MERSITTRPTLDQWIRSHLAARAFSRRTLLGGLTLLGCSSGSGSDTTGTRGSTSTTTPTSSTTTATTSTTTTTPGSCVLIPQETVGPYPLFNDIASAAAHQRADFPEGKTGVPLRRVLDAVVRGEGGRIRRRRRATAFSRTACRTSCRSSRRTRRQAITTRS